MKVSIIRERVQNMKEGLEKVDILDPSMNNLHQRIYDLKISLEYVDREIQKTNILTTSNIPRVTRLISLKRSYLTELENLELLL